MIFRQFIHDDLGCASYVVGDEHAAVVAVVDPKLDIEGYLALARYMGVRIEHVLETHDHADHVSGHGRLVAATGATIHVHRLAQPDYDHEPIDDGWELELGSVVIHALHTPGHRPQHTAFALVDTARGPEPWAVLSGDALFVVDKDEGARDILRSLHEQVLVLPDACEVWPGHLGGSLCGGPGMDMKVSSTIGSERAHNALLGIDDEDAFVHETTSKLGPQPPIVALNRGPLVAQDVRAGPLTPRQVAAKHAEGALLVDVRTDLQFDDAHIPGAVCNPAVRAGFGTKLAWFADRDHDVIFIGRDDDDARHAEQLAASVGIGRIAGHLSGGMTTWREERRPTQAPERIDIDALHERIGELQVLDVRARTEVEQGHIAGSVDIRYHDVVGIPDGIDGKRPVAVVCSSGQRAALAGSMLQRHGASDVIHVADGADGAVGTWAARGWPLEQSAPVVAPS